MAVPTADIIVIGASAGGVEALRQLVGGLRPNFPAAILVVLHVPTWSVSRLPEILTRSGPLPASHPQDGSPVLNGNIYVAPPDQHLLVSEDRIKLSAGPKENRHRPAVNALFRSAAFAYGPRVIGVVLTGALDDGASGLWEIKQHGGKAIVQEPSDALFPDMPKNALENVPVDYVVPLADIPALLMRQAGQPVPVQGSKKDAKMKSNLTNLTCPECRGPISEYKKGPVTEFACRVGHSYSPQTFLASHAETRERALWAAVVALEEGAEVARELAAAHSAAEQRRLEQEAGGNESAARTIRELLALLTRENSQNLMEDAT
jgi:two-component system chemotaxis response regulator CheB